MLSDADRNKAVDILEKAFKDRKQATQLSTTWPNITIEDAYGISTLWANRRMKAGAKLIGHKVGLTSKAMQRSSNIGEPDFGYLFDDMIIPDGGKVQHADYCRPRVEIELAFVLGKRLMGPGVGLTDVLARDRIRRARRSNWSTRACRTRARFSTPCPTTPRPPAS